MSVQFKAYAIRSGDLWWSSRQDCFVDAPDESSFTPTLAGSAEQRISRNVKMHTRLVEQSTAEYTPEYAARYGYSYPKMLVGLANKVAVLEQWRNARVVEVAVNVTEKQND